MFFVESSLESKGCGKKGYSSTRREDGLARGGPEMDTIKVGAIITSDG